MTTLIAPARWRQWPRCQQRVWLRWLRPRYWHRWRARGARGDERYHVCERCGLERG